MLQFGFDPSILRGRRAFQLPDGIGIVRDLSVGQWVESRLQLWGKDGVTLRSFLPDAFPAYARIFHPFYLGEDAVLDRGEEQPVRWSTVAEWTGATVHPLMQIGRCRQMSPMPYRVDLGRECPDMGSLPVRESAVLTGLLRDFTMTPDNCYLGYWEGYGCLNGGTVYLYAPGRGWFSRAKSMIHNLWDNLRPAPDILLNVPRLKGQGRDYILFRSPLETVPPLSQYPPWGQSPSLWWPEDRAWCVATDVDAVRHLCGWQRGLHRTHPELPRVLESLPFSIDGPY